MYFTENVIEIYCLNSFAYFEMRVKYAKTLYQILIKVYSIETSNISSKYMKLGKLFIMKQNIIIYKIYKQDLLV